MLKLAQRVPLLLVLRVLHNPQVNIMFPTRVPTAIGLLKRSLLRQQTLDQGLLLQLHGLLRQRLLRDHLPLLCLQWRNSWSTRLSGYIHYLLAL